MWCGTGGREGLSRKQIAARVGRTRETIAAQLRDDDFRALKRELNAEMAEEARHALNGYVRSAAKDWVTASAIAAKRGDHKPAKELLLHAGVIKRLGETAEPQVTVLVGMPGAPALIPPSQEVIDAAPTDQVRDALRSAPSVPRSRAPPGH